MVARVRHASPSRRFLLAAALLVAAAPCGATTAGEPRAAGAAATYELIARYDVAHLDAILAEEVPRAVESKVAFTPARNAVRLYRVTYPSVVPEQGNRPTVASGLVAIPEIDGTVLPVVSYQHGTVFGKEDVPSVPENSFETRLMIAQFAGLGLCGRRGGLLRPGHLHGEGRLHRDGQPGAGLRRHATATALAVLAEEGITPAGLFLTGWSQGGVVTMGLLEHFENVGVTVTAVGTACPSATASS